MILELITATVFITSAPPYIPVGRGIPFPPFVATIGADMKPRRPERKKKKKEKRK